MCLAVIFSLLYSLHTGIVMLYSFTLNSCIYLQSNLGEPSGPRAVLEYRPKPSLEYRLGSEWDSHDDVKSES